MSARLLILNSYFDGTTYRNDGPYTVCIEDGQVSAIVEGDHDDVRSVLPAVFRFDDVTCDRSDFGMPGLVEAHAHLFLEGSELDARTRAAYLKTATTEDMLAVARKGIVKSINAGVTLIRDAGDRSGINTAIREETAEAGGVQPVVLSSGVALRKPKRYGSFMAREVDSIEEIERAVLESVPCVDQVKVLMTGIIDFESGKVKGRPQFTVEEASRIVEIARAHGMRTFAHCSGLEGIRVAVEAGIDSIEHGFFVDRPTLDEMAEKQIAWVPTFSPVYIQWARPDLVGWGEESVNHLGTILDAHREHLRYAHCVGVPIVVGTDAGSYGVDHGGAVAVEIDLMQEAGLPMAELLCAATTRPRRLWGAAPGDIAAGAPVDIATFERSPFDDPQALEQVQRVYKDSEVLTIQAPSYQSA